MFLKGLDENHQVDRLGGEISGSQTVSAAANGSPASGRVAVRLATLGSAKVALVHNECLVTYRRTADADLPFPGLRDLPGGGIEPHESPIDCAIREVEEECGLILPADGFCWVRKYPGLTGADPASFFFVIALTVPQVASLRFADEGEDWRLEPFDAFLARQDAVPALQQWVRDYFSRSGARR